MRQNTMKTKLYSGEPAVGVSLTFPSSHMVEILAHCGFDWVLLDCEHGSMTAETVETMIMASELAGIIPIIRPPASWSDELPRLLDRGAMGVQMPHIRTADDAKRAVEAVKYPPLGNRGLDGAGLDGDFGLEVWHEGSTYINDANRETFIVLQIETPEALANVDEIAAVDGVDGLFVGPADLGLRLGQAGGNADLDQAIARVAEVAQKRDKAWGMPAGTPEALAALRAQGAQLLAYGGDFALAKVLADCSQDLDRAFGE